MKPTEIEVERAGTVLGCARVDDTRQPVKGSQRRVCAACGAALWASRACLEAAGPQARLVCARTCMPGISLDRVLFPPALRAELEAEIGRPIADAEIAAVLADLVRQGVLQPARPLN